MTWKKEGGEASGKKIRENDVTIQEENGDGNNVQQIIIMEEKIIEKRERN